MVLLDIAGARRQQQTAFVFVTGAFLIAALLAGYAIQRRRAIVARLNAQDALRRANDQLELTVAQHGRADGRERTDAARDRRARAHRAAAARISAGSRA